MNLKFLGFIGLDDEFDNILSLSLRLVTGVIHTHSIQLFEELESIPDGSFDALISFSQNLMIKKKIELYSVQHKLPCLCLSSGKSKNFTFYSDHSEECFASAIFSIVNYFALENPTILWTFTDENLKIIEYLLQINNFGFSQISFFGNL